jgi:hypothetical protein
MRPKNPRSLSLKNEVIIVAYRWRTRLSLDEFACETQTSDALRCIDA